MDAGTWVERSRGDIKNKALNLSDGRYISYPELLAAVGPRYERCATAENFDRQANVAKAALDRLADDLEAAKPDVVIVVGDDQKELFGAENQPAISIYFGDEIVTRYGGDHDIPDWYRQVRKGYAMDEEHRFPGHQAFALQLISGLLDRDVDVATSSKVADPKIAGFGHAFGFVVERLFKGKRIPIVPVLLNTYYPPNVMSPSRCVDVGRKMREVIEAMESDCRVAIVASGGLSHFVTDEDLDRRVLRSLSTGDMDSLQSIPRQALNDGSSEILNWILTAGALNGLAVKWTEYEPVYRTPAGTGIGLGFVAWSNA
jgi:3-O-methylgallate 3,4-dioxygenase